MCKLVTVNCLSQYSGCKCILTFTNKSIAISQAYPHLMWINKGELRWDISQTWIISWMCLSIDFIFFILKSLADVKPEELWVFLFVFFLVCIEVFQTSTVIVCEKAPQRCTAWIITCPLHCELTAGEKKKKSLFWLLLVFDWVFEFPDVVLVVPCLAGRYQSSACISSTKPLCKIQT